MGHISKRSITNDPELVKTKKLRESYLELEGPAEKLSMLTENSKERTNASSLISHTEVWPVKQRRVCTVHWYGHKFICLSN